MLMTWKAISWFWFSQAGASRSAAVVIAYMMRSANMSREAALEFVRQQRPIVK